MEKVMPETKKLPVESIVKDVLNAIPKEREREIVSRRFGLFDRKETLEQIGELLGITRERVRQLEKAIITSLKTQASEGKLPRMTEVETSFVEALAAAGNAARVSDLASVVAEDGKYTQAQVSFLSQLCPKLAVIDDNDHFHQSVALRDAHDEKAIKKLVDRVIEAIKAIGKPATVAEIAKQAGLDDASHAKALAATSKHLATLNGKWGLVKWPTVNPKNIRDKIYVILQQKGTHMHFNEIAEAIKDSSFKRKDVTTQAIHNELIKDKRFVLIGRGLYALKEWGYKKGTVSDIIIEVLKKAGEPLHRDEIVKEVLKSRYVKETTILLNLQSKPQFKRTAKATYTLAD
jgi:DNA-directed RNA polymerase delta subunit/DNA-binding phage protein